MKPTILVVEDEFKIAEEIKEILEIEGYEVITYLTTVNNAIKLIETHQPVLVLMETHLRLDTKNDGISLGQFLLNKGTIPYIYITSSSDNVTLDRVKDTRPHGMIIKPFKPIDIKAMVSIVLNNQKHQLVDSLRKEENLEEFMTYDVPFALKEVVDYMNANIDLRLDVREISKMTKWKYMHFIRVFTKYIGVTPYQYLLKKKVAKAKLLISETEIPLTQISVELGFNCYSNFCNVFKREVGTTPNNLRKFSSPKEI